MNDLVPKKTGSQAALHIAATLCYLACIFYMISAIVLAMPALRPFDGRLLLQPLYLVITSVLYGVAGFLVRKEQRRGGILALGMIVGRLALLAAAGGPYFNMWVLIDVVILVVIAVNWRQLRDPGTSAV